MRKEDYIRKLIASYKFFENKDEDKETLIEPFLKKPQDNWQQLVDFAADFGLESLELQDQIRMAELAKDVLRDKSI